MMTENKDQNPDMLGTLFSAAQEHRPEPSAEFMARMQAEALAVQPVAGLRDSESLWSRVRNAVGGWPGIAGLVATSIVGVWIGVSPPEGVLSLYDLQSAAMGALGVDPLSGFDLALLEG